MPPNPILLENKWQNEGKINNCRACAMKTHDTACAGRNWCLVSAHDETLTFTMKI